MVVQILLEAKQGSESGKVGLRIKTSMRNYEWAVCLPDSVEKQRMLDALDPWEHEF